MQALELSGFKSRFRIFAKFKLKRHQDFGAKIFFTRNLNRTAHHVNDILRDGHAKTCALNAAHRRRIHAGKRIENLLQECFAHADAVIFHQELINAIARFSRQFLDIHRNESIFRRVLDGVRNNV